MIRKIAFMLGLLIAAAGIAAAAKFVEREMPCPVCGKTFYARLDLSGEQSPEMRLDLKPVGEISWPWLLPDCPKCGFVVYRLPVPAAELAKCREFTATEEYKKARAHSSYYRVGLLYGRLGLGDYALANSFLKASWQEESDPAKLKEDQELALKYFTACARTCAAAEEKENSLLLMGELLRRLGRFDEARAHLAKLQGLKGFQKNFFADIVEFQLARCARQDAAPYEIEDVRDFKRTLLEKLKLRLKKLLKYVTEAGDKEAEAGSLKRKAVSPGAEPR
ncbi:MAG: hypothetical protein A3J70_01110 [Elusimicrobia bacterium RIFCSPHIGHO2_02_FULL_61_10]|nr:MAG: hypothetical protein A3I76_08190 [Elusimicrobia bacterium RIFCSPLOWO2_02_FULL_61_11]OGS15259.1 MAG: hypothetical protein A3J70_01110 [Elusimicrobia bacterium RIFCSPHIGHO2_02_FULL_61_10]